MKRRKLMLGNWKMNKLRADVAGFVSELRGELGAPLQSVLQKVDIGIAPSFLCLEAVAREFSEAGWWNVAQNVHHAESGAFTGEISMPMLAELQIDKVLIGHSERRQYFGEDSQIITKKTSACVARGFHPIVCIGESLEQRKSNLEKVVIEDQLRTALATCRSQSDFTIAYEPVWAIGTGLAATASQAQEMHQFIRSILGKLVGADRADQLRIIYGGSTKPDNIAELLKQPDIDGALVGGASLSGAGFAQMIMHAL